MLAYIDFPPFYEDHAQFNYTSSQLKSMTGKELVKPARALLKSVS
jgi:hypothetical protein